MSQQVLAIHPQFNDTSSPQVEIVEETKLLFNHQGSDRELVKQIAIAIHAIRDLTAKA
ncbi:MAG: hypothetical protein MUF49_22495 [Oculatellaceae cyanobacterium Prado106]|jgi:hypothetical protein|nr:hypothetical protein [Oculatellaceae cyanobacterium Prado106]